MDEKDNYGCYSIFRTDKKGNNVLHMCALNGLQDMYDHIYQLAEEVIKNKLTEIYTKRLSCIALIPEEICSDGMPDVTSGGDDLKIGH